MSKAYKTFDQLVRLRESEVKNLDNAIERVRKLDDKIAQFAELPKVVINSKNAIFLTNLRVVKTNGQSIISEDKFGNNFITVTKPLKKGKTSVNINLITDDNIFQFKLKNSKDLDRKSLNLIRKQQIQATIL